MQQDKFRKMREKSDNEYYTELEKMNDLDKAGNFILYREFKRFIPYDWKLPTFELIRKQPQACGFTFVYLEGCKQLGLDVNLEVVIELAKYDL